MMYEVFDEKFITQQKESLLKMRSEILNHLKNSKLEDLHSSADQTTEDGDQAQVYLDQNVSFGLKERELNRLREVEAALERIQLGVYGICEETDEPISKKRLQKMPWARLCIEAAEALERSSGLSKTA